MERQVLQLIRAGRVWEEYPVSTAEAGLGFEEGSNKTPTGRFRIIEMIGDDAPLGTVFRSRKPTAETFDPASEADQITSRILWLDGLEKKNRNTKARYIYLHGTNHESQLGTPRSHGCIRLSNSDVVTLFDRLVPQTRLLIG